MGVELFAQFVVGELSVAAVDPAGNVSAIRDSGGAQFERQHLARRQVQVLPEVLQAR